MNNFKSAIRTCIIFLIVLTILSAAIMSAFFIGENYYYQDSRERAELSGTLDFFVCGASHAMRGFRPDILDQELGINSYNLSCSRQTMQGRYELLNLELNRNPAKTVVLELSYDSMTRNRDEEGPEGDMYMLGKLGGFMPRIKYFFSAIRPKEYGRMYYNYIDNGVNCIKKIIHGTWTNKNTKLEKGYAAYKRDDDELNQDLKKIYHTRSFEETVYEPNVEYLNKIIALCKEKNVQLILVTTPLSKVTVCRYGNLDTFKEWYENVANENGLQYYDFNLIRDKEEKLPDSSAFSDKFHLGNKGAGTFTKMFTDVLNKEAAGEDTSALFYGSYSELESHMTLDK